MTRNLGSTGLDSLAYTLYLLIPVETQPYSGFHYPLPILQYCFSHGQVGHHGGESGRTGDCNVNKGNLRNKNARGSVTILKTQLESSIRSAFGKKQEN